MEPIYIVMTLNKNKPVTLFLSIAVLIALTVPLGSGAIAEETNKDFIITFEDTNDAIDMSRYIVNNGGEVLDSHWAIGAISANAKKSVIDSIVSKYTVEAYENTNYALASDTFPTPSWGVDRIDQESLPLDSSYTTSNLGAGVDIYIVDSGINLTHIDFAGRIKPGNSFINDGRGVSDCNGHGTHISGIAAGQQLGVAKESSIIPVRIFGCANETDTLTLVSALDWIIMDHVQGQPAVVNLSLSGESSSFVDTLMEELVLDGITVVAAAGNSSLDACAFSPGRSNAAITVGASEANDAHAFYSNYGSCVDLYAPGGGDNISSPSILSAWIGSDRALAYLSGSSQAAPHVVGAAAIYLSLDPYASPNEVKLALLNNAAPVIYGAPQATTSKLLQLTYFLDGPAVITPPPVVAPPVVAPVAPPVVAPPVVAPPIFVAPVAPPGVPPFTENVVVAPIAEEPAPPIKVSPSRVAKMSFGYSTSGAVRLYWSKPSIIGTSPILRYEIRISKTSSGKTWTKWVKVPASRSSYLLPKQKKKAKRYIEIRVVTADGTASRKTVFRTR
jgi:subtilisin family serine protease